ncbi:MAG TPA: hypothetical protein VES01_04410 [Dermatophilaceae bacterium]|nr:hypothetical protein [Dermatophilaceae bacterium]
MTTKATRSTATRKHIEAAAIATDVAATVVIPPETTDALACYLGVCPTCLGWHDDSDDVLPRSTAVCPTCGESSVEWALSCEIDTRLRQMRGMEALDRAIQQL